MLPGSEFCSIVVLVTSILVTTMFLSTFSRKVETSKLGVRHIRELCPANREGMIAIRAFVEANQTGGILSAGGQFTDLIPGSGLVRDDLAAEVFDGVRSGGSPFPLL